MADEPPAPTPDWIKITKAYDVIDTAMDNMITEDKMNFLELSIVMMMAREKLDQEKIGLYFELAKQTEHKDIDDKGLYR